MTNNRRDKIKSIVMAVELRILSRGTRGKREQVANLIGSISFGYASIAYYNGGYEGFAYDAMKDADSKQVDCIWPLFTYNHPPASSREREKRYYIRNCRSSSTQKMLTVYQLSRPN